MKTAAAAVLLALAPAPQALAGTVRTQELQHEVEDLRAELDGLKALLTEGQERRLQAPVVTEAAFWSEVYRLGNASAEVATAATEASNAVSSGDAELGAAMDSMWLLLCGTLVMFMHAGFAMLETGCCRAKNASNVLMKNLVNVCIGTLAWYFLGWGIAYGGPLDDDGYLENGFIGTKEFAASGFLTDTPTGYAPYEEVGQSKMLAWFFQWAFCTAAATIVSGGVAERVKSPTYACYAFVMASFIYPVVVSWTWGYGWLAKIFTVGYMDFAGSGIVHLTGGVSALAGAVVLGPRKGRFERPEEFGSHSLPLVVLGTLSLWFGWYGFNCGSTLGMSDASTGALAAQVAMNTTCAAATGGITVFVLRYALTKLYDVGGLCNGILAGLVSITAPCGNVETGSAIAIGLIGGIVYQASSMLQQKLKIDDPVDASSVHGACGIWGVLATALFDWGKGFDQYNGWSGFNCMTDDNGDCQTGIWASALGAQCVLILAVIGWAGTLSGVTFFVLKMTGQLRIDEVTEESGMDSKMHSPSKAYAFEAQA